MAGSVNSQQSLTNYYVLLVNLPKFSGDRDLWHQCGWTVAVGESPSRGSWLALL